MWQKEEADEVLACFVQIAMGSVSELEYHPKADVTQTEVSSVWKAHQAAERRTLKAYIKPQNNPTENPNNVP